MDAAFRSRHLTLGVVWTLDGVSGGAGGGSGGGWEVEPTNKPGITTYMARDTLASADPAALNGAPCCRRSFPTPSLVAREKLHTYPLPPTA